MNDDAFLAIAAEAHELMLRLDASSPQDWTWPPYHYEIATLRVPEQYNTYEAVLLFMEGP